MDILKLIGPTFMRALWWRHAMLAILIFGSLIWILSLEPITQNTGYHSFADTRNILGIPSCFDVVSSVPFLAIGILGLRFCVRTKAGAVQRAWVSLFLGVGLAGIGSVWYHLNPTNESLVWDRLPMTIGFMGLFMALLGEYVSSRLVTRFLGVAILYGLATVLYWHWTGDLRPYYWVQLVPFLTIPAVIVLFRSNYSHQWLLIAAFGWYVLAKIAESYDMEIFRNTHEVVSGHTLKHLLAAAGCSSILLMLQRRKQSDSEHSFGK